MNKPRCAVANYERDGAMATAQNHGSKPNYWPNSREGSPEADEQYMDPAWKLGTVIVDRYDSTVDHDNFTQPGNMYRMFDDAHRDRLTTRIAGVLGQARKEVQERQLAHFFNADEDYGRRVAEKLGMDVSKFAQAAGASA